MAEAGGMNRTDRNETFQLPATDMLSITAAPASARFILRGDAGVVQAASAAFGLALPQRLAAVEAGGRAALWLGPDEWLLIGPVSEGETIRADLDEALAGLAHSLVDVSHRQTGYVISGRRAARVLSAGCPLDFRAPAFPVGMVVRTILAKAEIVLWRQDHQRFHLEVWRSFAPYVTSYLAEAARGAPDV